VARRDVRTTATPPNAGLRLPAWGRWLLLAGALWLLLAFLYPGAVFRGEVFASSDAVNSDAFRVAGDRSLADGHYPLWNPYLFAGMPSFGSLAYARFLYPPSVVIEPLQQHLGFAPLTWMLAHLLFGGLGMAWLLSRWRLPLPLLLLGAAAWLMLPKVVAWGVHGHGSKLLAAMYLPWIVGWAWRVLDGGGARAVGMTGLLLGLQLLRGHVQISYYTLVAVGFLTVWNAAWPLDEAARNVAAAVRWKRGGLVLGGLAIGFLIGAMLLVPVHQYAGISIRGQDTEGGGGVGLDYATGWSLAPQETPTFVLPAWAGFGKATYLGFMPFNDYPNYFGVLLIALAAAAWRPDTRSLAAALLVMSLLAVLTSFGGGFYELLYRWLPFFNKFRIPSMILVLVGFSVIVLAMRGLAAFIEGASFGGRPVVLPVLLAVAGAAMLAASAGREAFTGQLGALAAAAGKQAPPVLLDAAWQLQRGSVIRIGLVLLASAAALYYGLRNETFRRRGLVWVMAILVVADLAGVARLIVHPEKGLQDVARDPSGRGVLVQAGALGHKPAADRGAVPPGPAADELLAAVGHDRVWPLGSHGQRNTWLADGVRSLGGYHPAKLAAYEQIRRRLYGQQPAARLANWLGASVIAFDQPFTEGDLAFLADMGADLDPAPLRAGRPAFYRNRSALPRARLVTAWRPAADVTGGGELQPFLDAIESGREDVARAVALDRRPEPEPAAAAALPVPVFVRDAMDEVVLTTSAPVPAVLVLADMNAPGWKVEVDGREQPLLTADLVLRAVALEAGDHTVRFVYADPSVRAGLALSLTGAALVALLLILPVLGRRRPAAAGAAHD
jgi:hypothetical protein